MMLSPYTTCLWFGRIHVFPLIHHSTLPYRYSIHNGVQDRYGAAHSTRQHRHAATPIRLQHNATKQSTILYGFLNNQYLSSIQLFHEWSDTTIQQCNKLLDKLRRNLDTNNVLHTDTIHYIDHISDVLCVLLDTCELIRNVHVNKQWRMAADTVFNKCYIYMESLNTNKILFHSITQIINNKSYHQSLPAEYQYVAIQLYNDMVQHGTLQSDHTKQMVARYVQRISELQQSFTQTVYNTHNQITVPNSVLSYIDQRLHNTIIEQTGGTVTLSNAQHIINDIMFNCSDSNTRMHIYIADLQRYTSNITVLNELIHTRHKLAECVDYTNYADYHLSNMLLNNTADVQKFIVDTLYGIQPLVQHELHQLQSMKYNDLSYNQQQSCTVGDIDIYQWDYIYYTNKSKHHTNHINQYFTIDNILNGLCILCHRLFHCEFIRMELDGNEQWCTDMYKYGLYDNNQLIGIVYLDLYKRNHKFDGAASFTIQCTRKLYELHSDQQQLPIIALVCNLHSPYNVTHGDCAVILHEFGHILHHCLSTTKLQHCSGTRTQLDYVEIPSILIESYVWNYDYVKLWAKNTNHQSISESEFNIIRSNKAMYYALELQQYCIHALYDQLLYSQTSDTVECSDILYNVTQQYSSIKYTRDSLLWHSKQTHLCHYAAGYYVYLYDRLLSIQLYNKLFAGTNGLDYTSGNILRNNMLCLGGTQSGDRIINQLLHTNNLQHPNVQQLIQYINTMKQM